MITTPYEIFKPRGDIADWNLGSPMNPLDLLPKGPYVTE
jgi:hypothetical protein